MELDQLGHLAHWPVTEPPPEVLIDLATEVRGQILRDQPPDTCILSSRTMVAVLHACGVQAYTLWCKVLIKNEVAWRLDDAGVNRRTPEGRLLHDEEGSWTIGIGYGKPAGARFWGHVVAVAARRWMHDLSLDQANRPERGIRLGTVVFDVPEAFLSGREALTRQIGSVRVRYIADPTDTSVRATGYRKHAVQERVLRELHVPASGAHGRLVTAGGHSPGQRVRPSLGDLCDHVSSLAANIPPPPQGRISPSGSI